MQIQSFVAWLKLLIIGDENITTVHYWLYSPCDNAKIWDECYDNGIMAIGWDRIGDLSDYQSKEEMRQKMQELMDPNLSWKMAALATWQFANEMKPGDVIFAKRGMHRKMSQTELAERSNMSYGSLKRFEQTGKISLESLLKIAVVLNASEPFSDLFRTTEITSIQQIINGEFD